VRVQGYRAARMQGAARRWADLLDGWTIPDEILFQATEPPWGMSPDWFSVPARPDDTPSRRLALEALREAGSVLDVGCGAGTAGLALVPPASALVGVDESPAMLARFREECEARRVRYDAVEGSWPSAAARASAADVVVCHHVLYNARDLVAFVVALSGRARQRVVVEVGAEHPSLRLAPLWRRFWDLDRPDGPRVDDAVAVLGEAGIDPIMEVTAGARPHARSGRDTVALVTRRLCLPPQRRPEVAAALAELPAAPSEVHTLAWSGDA
jgi:SAM-dependent methyltransferase